MKKNKNFLLITYIGVILCAIIMIFDSDDKILNVLCGIVIGMNLSLLYEKVENILKH